MFEILIIINKKISKYQSYIFKLFLMIKFIKLLNQILFNLFINNKIIILIVFLC